MPQYTDTTNATVTVEHIGGIDHCELSVSPGITVLTGRNATNRTSFLRAVSGALGGSVATVKSDADEGAVTLDLNGETYTRHYARRNGETVATGGAPYTAHSDLVDLFACILETNPARRAVERGDDIRDVIMRPVDTDEIQERIQTVERERDRLDTRLDEIDREQDRLPSLIDKREQLEEEVDEITDELDAVRQAVAAFEADADTAEAAEDLLADLESTRQDLSEKRNQIQTHRSSIEALAEEREQLQTERADLDAPNTDREEIEQDLQELQARDRELETTITDLAAIVDVNDDIISGELPELHSADDAVTARLDPDSETIECWTCGSHVERSTINQKLEELQTLIETKRNTRHELQERIEDLRDTREALRSVEARRTEIDDRLAEIDRECSRREDQIADLESTVEALEDEIQTLEREVEDTENLRESELLEQYQRLSELEYERGQAERDLSSVRDDIEQIEELVDERDQVEAQRDHVQEELASLRTRIEDLEQTAVEAFNEHMAEVLALLAYENLERVWIERKSGSNPRSEGTFELHVVRETSDGAVYEDTVDHLSESEREVVGLIVALAGYLVHEVADEVPMMLLDSLEAIDADRIARLVEYFAEQSSFLVVALLPEDAQALPDSYPRLSVENAEG